MGLSAEALTPAYRALPEQPLVFLPFYETAGDLSLPGSSRMAPESLSSSARKLFTFPPDSPFSGIRTRQNI